LTTPFSRTGNDPVVAHPNDQAHCPSRSCQLKTQRLVTTYFAQAVPINREE
jgi:hypothetical protein